MGTIPQELVTFKSTVSSNIGKMNSTLSEISSKLTDTVSANNTAKEGVNEYYNSKNKDAVLEKFTYLNNVYDKINTSISSVLKKMLSDSETIINKVTELESINKSISEKNQKISELESDVDDEGNTKHDAEISDLKNEIKDLEDKFESIKNETLGMLSSLKGMDSTITI